MEETLASVAMFVMDDHSFILAFVLGAAFILFWFELRRWSSGRAKNE